MKIITNMQHANRFSILHWFMHYDIDILYTFSFYINNRFSFLSQTL